jgi:hypothetical protein
MVIWAFSTGQRSVAKSENERPILILPLEAAAVVGAVVAAGAVVGAGAIVAAGAAGAVVGVAAGAQAASIATRSNIVNRVIETRLDFISLFPFITFVISEFSLPIQKHCYQSMEPP